jgi:PIN domain nuclease of toxin-antitoxin system
MENPRNELYLSPVSIWEAHHLSLRRKLRYSGSFIQWLERAWRVLPVKEAPVNFAVSQEASTLQLPQGDFGDLFLAASASVFDLTLVTADAQLVGCRSIKTLDAG